MRILVSKEILREAAKTEQLVENAESKKYALNPFGKACFFIISCIIPAYPVEQ